LCFFEVQEALYHHSRENYFFAVIFLGCSFGYHIRSEKNKIIINKNINVFKAKAIYLKSG
jgi:hypothetical protein